MEQLASNVLEFINKCSKEVGSFQDDNFNQEIWNNCQDLEMESPIEQIFYCALQALIVFNYIDSSDPIEINGKYYAPGIGVFPQQKVGNYRCDFKVNYETFPRQDGIQRINKSIIVECDSQQFHERTERERRYEKIRDRYFTAKGYKIFHFTGSEIVNKPYQVAAEVIAYVTECDIKSISQDNGIED